MATQEFYIRNASETEARGPFTIEQLVSLAEAGQVTADTLYYDANAERWLALGSDLTIKAAIFPEKKKLVIKKAVRVGHGVGTGDHLQRVAVDFVCVI